MRFSLFVLVLFFLAKRISRRKRLKTCVRDSNAVVAVEFRRLFCGHMLKGFFSYSLTEVFTSENFCPLNECPPLFFLMHVNIYILRRILYISSCLIKAMLHRRRKTVNFELGCRTKKDCATYCFFCHKQTKTMLCVTILQTLSGEDVPGIDSLDSQISDVDPESKTWNRSRVVMLI